MRGRTLGRFGSFPVALALLLSALLPVQADALTHFNQAPSTKWGYTYAGPATTDTSSTKRIEKDSGKSGKLEEKSKFVITYKNFPEWAKKEFQLAADVWGANFQSSTPINIDATWTRSASYGVLGSARPGSFFQAFAGAPDQTLWYPSALANALAGKDLDPKNPEMIIQINSAATWNTRGDGAPRSNEYDLQSVFVHEMGHGLGFLSTDSYDTFFGFGTIEQPTPYDAYAQLPDGQRLSDLPSPSLELGKAITGTLVWSGAFGVAANGGVKPILYTPKKYEEGSSVSHLDEDTFGSAGLDAAMTPNLDAGEIFHEPGPLLLAMMEDLRRKPPAGLVIGVPQPVRNAAAIVSESALLVKFDPPANARTSQVISYTVRNLKTDQEKVTTQSPVLFTGLKNGTSYSFSITATNINGTSDLATTSAVTPQATWKRTTLDATSDGKNVTSTTYNGQPVIAYTDSKKGLLKLALWNGAAWRKVTVDGAGGSAGRTRNPITSPVSLCVNGTGTKQILHIFYSENVDQDLRYATYNGKNFTYEVVDGNGPTVNDYKDLFRVRTASDVSVSSACVANTNGIQVFYRDESQGILLGATKAKGESQWSYELVDGDRKTDGRTTGDVAFHLKALYDGKKTYVLYDSVLTINQAKEATSGEVRIASRTGFDPFEWSYKNLDSSGSSAPVTGFDVALTRTSKGIFASWLISSPATSPKADRIRWTQVQTYSTLNQATTADFGLPSRYLSTDGSNIAFNCQNRLCVLDTSKTATPVRLISTEQSLEGFTSTWVILNKVKYLVAGVKGQLSLFRP